MPPNLTKYQFSRRAGARVELGDLNKEWQESQAIAQTKPDLKTLDARVLTWLEKKVSARLPH